MMVRGFERHTYMCSACSDIEKRFVFNKHDSDHGPDAAAPRRAAYCASPESASSRSESIEPGDIQNTQPLDYADAADGLSRLSEETTFKPARLERQTHIPRHARSG
jgi:hypothetical protein